MYEKGKNSIYFYNLLEKKIITRINMTYYSESFTIISNDLLMTTGTNKISLININSYEIIRTINVPNSICIYYACMLNENQLLTGDLNKDIKQWKIEKNNLKLISKKENAHKTEIYTLLKIGDGSILSGGSDGYIKIWYYSNENKNE